SATIAYGSNCIATDAANFDRIGPEPIRSDQFNDLRPVGSLSWMGDVVQRADLRWRLHFPEHGRTRAVRGWHGEKRYECGGSRRKTGDWDSVLRLDLERRHRHEHRRSCFAATGVDNGAAQRNRVITQSFPRTINRLCIIGTLTRRPRISAS